MESEVRSRLLFYRIFFDEPGATSPENTPGALAKVTPHLFTMLTTPCGKMSAIILTSFKVESGVILEAFGLERYFDEPAVCSPSRVK